MRFSIITPSFRQLDWLRLCARSVADQAVEKEHIIQDAGTGSELEEWARSQQGVQLFVEPDAGIYDALNRGFSRASGDVLAWLNCDEQYLPGALEAVAARFAAEPELDVLLADNLIVDADGRYLAHRFSLLPGEAQCWVRFPVTSCALFFRRRVFRPFDTQWKSAGDWWWFMELLRSGARVGVLRRFVASFAETGVNLGTQPISHTEQAAIIAARPWWVRLLRPLLLAQHRARLLAAGVQRVGPFRYALYGRGQAERSEFAVAAPTARWRR